MKRGEAMRRWWRMAAVVVVSVALHARPGHAQSCTGGTAEGTVVDPTGAAVPGATVQAASGQKAVSSGTGTFALHCLAAGEERLTATAAGFAPQFRRVQVGPDATAHVEFRLALATVKTNVEVGGDEAMSLDPDQGIGTHTLSRKDIQELSDDPDDFRRELQVLAAANGGAPGAARMTVDGFQNSSALPPKGSIARIVTAPDMFSAEYDTPPYQGGRVEIYTKPGADKIHGALFLTDSDSSFNANDPFSTVATPASKRRYGFELGGPIEKAKSDYFMALEKRDINEYNVVNAITLDAQGNEGPLHQTVGAPQRLWIASARADWQATKSDVFTLSFAANTNVLTNQGIGGLVAEDAGFDSAVSEYDLRATNTQTLSMNLLQETHVAWTWKDTAQMPLSTAPNLQVAGFFQSGGSTAQALNDRERNLEVDDDLLISRGRQTWKVGAQALGIFVHVTDPDTFNGAWMFGGGAAPVLDANGNPTGQTTTITALEQYRRALLHLPGGVPTSYTLTAGTALVPFTQWQLALYAEDTMKVNRRLTLSGGLRYALETSPGSYANFAPRAGVAWALDKRARTVLHLHAGLFSSVVPEGVTTEAVRLNGARQQEAEIYSPSFTSPLTPTGSSLAVTTVRSLPGTVGEMPSFQSGAGVEHDFPHHWHAQANVYYVKGWNEIRSRNINAPMVASSNATAADPGAALLAPRPIAPNKNIFQFEQTGHLSGDVVFLGLDQHSYRRFAFFLGYLNFNLTTDTANNGGFAQSAYSNRGEAALADWESRQRLFFFGNLNLPRKVELSAEMDAQSGQPYNVTTGTDNNGDGVFNDRPSYAASGGAGVYGTKFGRLSTNTVNGDVPRNLGTMPSLVHLDANLSRSWAVGGKKSDHPRTLRLNLRSANLLNHANASAVDTVLGSPVFGQAVAAESARRLELGMRFTF
ncbi:MAG TPA: TonB-dependent receptor [Acidobacteriaceae bacterium]